MLHLSNFLNSILGFFTEGLKDEVGEDFLGWTGVDSSNGMLSILKLNISKTFLFTFHGPEEVISIDPHLSGVYQIHSGTL